MRNVFLIPYRGFLGWPNQFLLKDCVLLPYMFYKVYGYPVTVLGPKTGELPYLRYLPGLNMEYLPDIVNSIEAHNDMSLFMPEVDDYVTAYNNLLIYLYTNYKTMDVIVAHGVFKRYYAFLSEYRRLRPDGKIVYMLDVQSEYVERMDWQDPTFSNMFDACDILLASCRYMQQYLSQKWKRWEIKYIPNGFYNYSGTDINVTYDDKADIILTAGRIGTWQKANEILMEAFVEIHHKIPSWCVRFVGNVEESFKPYVRAYYEKYPILREKVIFTGPLDDKDALFNEYKKAKIFVLTSRYEGGTPNVYAEAALHGCYMVTSQIDAAEDITNFGEIGKIFPQEDTEALADILINTCNDETQIREVFPKVHAYADEHFDWEKNIRQLHTWLWGDK